MVIPASQVGLGVVIFGLAFFAFVLVAGSRAIRLQARQFPKDMDRTGWEPRRDAAGWMQTKFTWLSGGRGG